MKLFENHPQDARVTEQDTCPTVVARYGTGGGNIPLVLMDQGGSVMNVLENIVGTIRANTHGNEPIVLMENGNDRSVQENISPPLRTSVKPVLAENAIERKSENMTCIPIDTMNLIERKDGSNGLGLGNDGDPSYTLTKTNSRAVSYSGCVRRLTPVECERLQGFPDNWTQIPYRGKPAEQCPDSPRYKAIGNSWAVPVVRWIGERIDKAMKEIDKNVQAEEIVEQEVKPTAKQKQPEERVKYGDRTALINTILDDICEKAKTGKTHFDYYADNFGFSEDQFQRTLVAINSSTPKRKRFPDLSISYNKIYGGVHLAIKRRTQK